VKTEIFLQTGLDTQFNKPPDGQITPAANACSVRVPDAVQRSSRCSAEPGPTSTLARVGPGSAAHHAAKAEVTKMIKVYGAPIDDAEVGLNVDYLAATY
jgi:hypothetical protein